MKDADHLAASWMRLLAGVLLSGAVTLASAQTPPLSGTRTIAARYPFVQLVSRVEQAVEKHKLDVVAQASASRGAASRGIKIPGNAVIMVFRNDYAVRMLNASVPAGIEAPLRIYVTENSDGSASLTYRLPSAVFAPYASPVLDAMAKELDAIFETIVRNATSG